MITTRKRGVLVVGIIFSMGLLSVNQSGFPVALVNITQTLKLTFMTEHWIINAYLLSLAAMLILTGRISSYFGHKKIYFLGHAIFLLGVIFAGSATHATMILLGRILQGAGAGALIMGNIQLMNRHFPNTSRTKLIGTVVAGSAFFLVIAPVLSGLVTEYCSWRWLFWANIPLIILALLCTLPCYKQNPNTSQAKPFILIRPLLIIISMFCLVTAIMEAPKWGILSAPTSVLLLIILISFITFIVIEHQAKTPFINRSVWQNKSIILANILLITAGFTMITEVYWALWFRRAMQFSPLITGLAMLAAIIPTLLISPFSKKIINRFGKGLPIILGHIMAFLGMSLMMRVALSHTYITIFPAMLIYGFAPPLIIRPTIRTALDNINAKQHPLVLCLANTSWQLGAALGIASMGWVIISYLHVNPHHISPMTAYSHGFVWSLSLPSLLSLFGLIISLIYWNTLGKN